VTDPLADPRATDLLAAAPDDISALAQSFRTAADEAQMTARGLDAARGDGTWTGKAADSFRDSIGRLPGELERVRAGYSTVSDALGIYETALAEIQSAFVKIVAELSDIRSRIAPAQAATQSAQQNFTATRQGAHVDRRALAEAELAVARAESTMHGYHAAIESLRGRAFTLLDDFSAVRTACHQAVAAAQRTAPVRPRTGDGTIVIGAEAQLAAPVQARMTMAVGGAGAGGDSLPAEDRKRINTMIQQADSLLGTPYAYGGGHAAAVGPGGGGLDCSGFVSAVLRSGGYLNGPVTTEGFGSQPGIATGHGHFVTIYDRTGCGPNEHVIIDINGRFYESGGGSASGGAPFVHQFTPSAEYLASFNTILHPAGL
jgi:cell wall-associated NlpC family hydrolase